MDGSVTTQKHRQVVQYCPRSDTFFCTSVGGQDSIDPTQRGWLGGCIASLSSIFFSITVLDVPSYFKAALIKYQENGGGGKGLGLGGGGYQR